MLEILRKIIDEADNLKVMLSQILWVLYFGERMEELREGLFGPVVYAPQGRSFEVGCQGGSPLLLPK